MIKIRCVVSVMHDASAVPLAIGPEASVQPTFRMSLRSISIHLSYVRRRREERGMERDKEWLLICCFVLFFC